MERAQSSGFAATFDWFFRNRRTGAITIAQFPNLALWLFVASVVARHLVTTGTAAAAVADWAGAAALAWWATDEVLRGVNPWRRILGAGGLVLVVVAAAARVR